MSGVAPIVAAVSLEVTRQLVAAGFGLGFDAAVGRFTAALNPSTGLPYPALAITAATNASPVVITTASPHGLRLAAAGDPRPAQTVHALVTGTTGNTAPANVSTDKQDVAVGLPHAVIAVPVGLSALALYTQDTNTLAPVPLAGNGVYAGGGTFVPALMDGRIRMDAGATAEHVSPPRVLMIPRREAYGPRSQSFLARTDGSRQADRRQQEAAKAQATSRVFFEVHCRGQAVPGDAELDLDAARVLAQVVQDAVALLAPNQWELEDATYVDQDPKTAQLVKEGRALVFGIGIATPVTDPSKAFIPAATSWQLTVASSPLNDAPVVLPQPITPG